LDVAESRAVETEKDIKDLASGALVSFVGKLARVSRGLFLWVVTFLCGSEVQFLYSLVWVIVSNLNRISRFGLHRGVLNAVVTAHSTGDEAQAERVMAAAVGISLLFSAVTVGLTILGADWLAAYYALPIAGAVRIMSWSVPFMSLAWVFVAATQALRIMRFEVYVNSIAGPLILLVGGVIVGLVHLGLTGIAWVQVAMAVGSCLLAAFFFGRVFSLRSCLRRLGRGTPWRELGRFSLPVMLADLLYGVVSQLDVLMLGVLAGPQGLGLAGVYVLAQRLASAMLKAPQSLDPIFSSVASELFTQQRHQELEHRFVVISRWILAINLPIFAGLLVVGDPLLQALEAGGRAQVLADGLQLLFLLCCSMMVQSIFAMVEPLLAMSGRPGLNLLNNTLWLGLNFGLYLWLWQVYGIAGVALGSLLGAVLINAIRLGQIYLLHDIFPFHGSQLKPVIAAAGAAAAGWLAGMAGPAGVVWAIGVPLVVFLGVYLTLLRLLGLEPEDRALLARLGRWVRRRLAK
jgi:O-antigen/teichoic acid export membrane protein